MGNLGRTTGRRSLHRLVRCGRGFTFEVDSRIDDGGAAETKKAVSHTGLVQEHANYLTRAELALDGWLRIYPNSSLVIVVGGGSFIGEQDLRFKVAVIIPSHGDTSIDELPRALQQLVHGECLCGRGDAGDEQYG